MKALVVSYSRTGITNEVAQAIGRELECEVEEIVDRKRRLGVLGYLRCGYEATFARRTAIDPPRHDPSLFDLVIVGSPVWNASVSSPTRSYLEAQRGRIRSVAFFCTYGGRGAARVFAQMQKIVGRPPIATLNLRDKQIARASYSDKVATFVERLRGATPLKNLVRTDTDGAGVSPHARP